MALRPLADLALTRSGDKGDTVDVTVFAREPAWYDLLVAEVTAERVAALVASRVRGEVTRYEVPRIEALKFVMTRALGGGGPSSLRADNLGKALGSALARLEIEVPDSVGVPPRPRPPRDPYSDAPWRVR